MRKSYLFTLMLFLMISCKDKGSAEFFEVSGDNEDSFKHKLGPYENIFAINDVYQGISCNRTSGYDQESSKSVSGFLRHAPNTSNKDKGFYFNDVSLAAIDTLSIDEKFRFIEKFLGTEVNLKQIKNDGKIVYDISLHMPNELIIDTALSGIKRYFATEKGKFHKDSMLYYNADPKNKNGILIKLIYNGMYQGMTSENVNKKHFWKGIRRYLYISNDDGKIKFPDGFFDEIPEGAFITLIVERGMFSSFDIGEYSYLLRGRSFISIPLLFEGV